MLQAQGPHDQCRYSDGEQPLSCAVCGAVCRAGRWMLLSHLQGVPDCITCQGAQHWGWCWLESGSGIEC